MAKVIRDGILRLQAQSRIPVATWRQWCALLNINTEQAVEVWEEICYPIMIATRKVPDVSYILQFRAAQSQSTILAFKEEMAKVLHCFTFLLSLKDEQLVRGKLKNALIKFYQSLSSSPAINSPAVFTEYFIKDLSTMVLVAKVITSDQITLSGVLKTIEEKRGSLDQIVNLANKSLDATPYSEQVREFFLAVNSWEHTKENEQQKIIDHAEEQEQHETTNHAEQQEPTPSILEPLEEVLEKFKASLLAIYKAEAAKTNVVESMAEDNNALLTSRAQTINKFQPLKSTIPTSQEAQDIIHRAEIENRNHGPQKHSTRNNFTASLSSLNTSSTSISSTSLSDNHQSDIFDVESRPVFEQQYAQESYIGKQNNFDATIPITVKPEDIVNLHKIKPGEFNLRVRFASNLLSNIESTDLNAWTLILKPTASIEDLESYARALNLKNTPAYQAYTTIKNLVQCLPLKQLIPANENFIQPKVNLSLQITTFINQINNLSEIRELIPENRILNSFKTILDYSSTALLRLEAIRVNGMLAESYPTKYNPTTAILYYEETLRALFDLTDHTLLVPARRKAAEDTTTLFGLFEIRIDVAQVIETCQVYAAALVKNGHMQSLDQVKEAINAQPVEFDHVPNESNPEILPTKYTAPNAQGDIFDTIVHYLYNCAWQVLSPLHQPEEALKTLHRTLPQILAPALTMVPERKRHIDNSQLPILVTGLDKVSGNANLKNLFVRLHEDGRLLYIEDYKDGSYMDIFNLQEYTPMRMQQAVDEGERLLQTGHQYLHTLGRTNNLFDTDPGKIIKSCITKEDGSTHIFPIFY